MDPVYILSSYEDEQSLVYTVVNRQLHLDIDETFASEEEAADKAAQLNLAHAEHLERLSRADDLIQDAFRTITGIDEGMMGWSDAGVLKGHLLTALQIKVDLRNENTR